MSENDKDFKNFMNSDPISPPKGLGENIFKAVSSDLNPSPWTVFSKLTLIHFFLHY